MEKLTIEEFRKYREKIIKLFEPYSEMEEEEEPEEEEINRLRTEYESLISEILQFDLSEVPAEEWEGFILVQTENVTLDFSKTSANIDFKFLPDIEFRVFRKISEDFDEKLLPNFKGCKISNFPFDKLFYTPEMFDDDFISEYKDRFLTEEVPEEIRRRFYMGKSNFEDLALNEELRTKISEEHLNWSEAEIYGLFGKEEFLKLDFEFMNGATYWCLQKIKQNPQMRTSKEMMEYLYKIAKEELVEPPKIDRSDFSRERIYARPVQLGKEFKKRNPELFVSKEVPSSVRASFEGGYLSLGDYIKNIEHFKDVDMRIAFSGENRKIYEYFSPDMYEIFKRYGKYILDRNGEFRGHEYKFEIPDNPEKTLEEKKHVLAEVIKKIKEGYSNKLTDIGEIAILSEILPIEDITYKDYSSIISAVGIEKLQELGYTDMGPFSNGITNVEQLLEISQLLPNISLVLPKNCKLPSQYTFEDMKKHGIEDITIFSKDFSQDLVGLKKLLDKGIPLEILPLGSNEKAKKEFIKKYGINNIIEFDNETKLFSTMQSENKNYQLEILAIQDQNSGITKKEIREGVESYQEFRNRIYELLVEARSNNGEYTKRNSNFYGHMEGEFRKEHPEIFISGVSIIEQDSFYKGDMQPHYITAENKKQFKGKKLELAFKQKCSFPGMKNSTGNIVGFIVENFAKYTSEKFGEEKFFELCLEYGDLIVDKTLYFTQNDFESYEEFKSKLEDNIYRAIIKGTEYTENLPQSFKERYPEIFLPQTVSEDIRTRFCKGQLTFEDIRKNPELVQILTEKELEVGFFKLSDSNWLPKDSKKIPNAPKYKQFFEKIPKQDILKLAEKYGKYLKAFSPDYFEEDYSSFEELEEKVKESITDAILNRRITYGEDVPEFFKQEHPECFLSEDAPELLKLSYYSDYTSKTQPYEAHMSSNYPLGVKFIKKHPEYRQYLEGKTLTLITEMSIRNLSTQFSTKEILDMASLDSKIVQFFESKGKTIQEVLDMKNLKGVTLESLSARGKTERELFGTPDSLDISDLLKLPTLEEIINIKIGNGKTVQELLETHKLDEETFKFLLENQKEIQQLLEMIHDDTKALEILSSSEQTVELLRNSIDERPKDKKDIVRFPGYTLYYSKEKREEFSFAEYKELVAMSKFKTSNNYRRETAEQILATMYEFLGHAGAKGVLTLPEIEESKVEEIISLHGKTFSELYEERFALEGNLKVLNTFFDKFVPQFSGKKEILNAYKLLNKKIEDGYDGSLEELVFSIMRENKIPFEETKIKAISELAIETNTSEKLKFISDRISSDIETRINETSANRKVLRNIVMTIYKKVLNNSEKLDENMIRELLEKEFARTNDEGETMYSPHITDHLEELMQITKEINDSQEYGTKMNKSVVDILHEEKGKIGQGWIRKLADLHAEMSKEEYECLSKKIYGENAENNTVQVNRIIKLKDSSQKGAERAYNFLRTLQIPEIFTYEKGEQMFAGLSKPYSENFKKFFLKYQKEILGNPECYTKFQKMHSEFEGIIEDSHISTRFKAGVYTLSELLDELNRITYPNVKSGEYELEYAAREAGLEKEYWPRAQEIYAKMQERESQTVPPIEVNGKKYRGRILRIDDPLHLVIGNITTCCQRFGRGQPGEPSMLHSALERNGSVFVVEEIDEQGRVVGGPIAQSWTWRNGDRICFDNVEIPDTLEADLIQKKAHDEILRVYMEAAKRMIDIDKKMLDKMLAEGKITQEQHEQFAIKEVTVGTGCDDLIQNISGELKNKLKSSNAVKPIEADKLYETVTGEMKKTWIDSGQQLILAVNEDIKDKKVHSTYSGEVTVEYIKIREVLRRKGRNIHKDLVDRMKDMLERAGKRESSPIGKLEGNDISELFEDVDDYIENEKSLLLSCGSNDDWYILTREEEQSITIVDSLITTGVNKVESQKPIDQKLARYEYLNEMLAIMQIADKKGKVLKIEPEREGSYLKLEPLIESGVLQMEEGKIRIEKPEEVTKIRQSLDKKIEQGRLDRLIGTRQENEDKSDDER